MDNIHFNRANLEYKDLFSLRYDDSFFLYFEVHGYEQSFEER